MRDIEVVDLINKAIESGQMKELLLGRGIFCIPTTYPDLPTDLALIMPHLYRFINVDKQVAKGYTKAIMSMIASDEIWQVYMAGQILLLQLFYEKESISPIVVSDTLINAYRIRYPEVPPFLKGRINKGNKLLMEKYQRSLL